MKFTPAMMTGLSGALFEFMLKMFKKFRVRYIIVLPLVILFIWWGSNAVLRYWNQPLTTDIRHSFGDNINGIEFPLITFCQYRFLSKNEFMKNCLDESGNFLSSFAHCLKTDTKFNIENFMGSLKNEIESIVEKVHIFTGSEHINLGLLDVNFWSMTFHSRFGQCYTFDLSKKEEFKFIPYIGSSRPGIEFMFAENNPWQQLWIILHSKNDLPDASVLNGHNIISFSNGIKEGHKINIRKKIINRESTRKVPCEQYEYQTCQDIENNELILNQFNCQIPILYNGPHLDDFIPDGILNCSNEVTKKALDLILNKESKCNRTQTCEMTRFTWSYKVIDSWMENQMLLFVAYENPEVEYHNTYISYDLLSLIGEVGGILGLTLGASALTLLESLIQRIPFIKI